MYYFVSSTVFYALKYKFFIFSSPNPNLTQNLNIYFITMSKEKFTSLLVVAKEQEAFKEGTPMKDSH